MAPRFQRRIRLRLNPGLHAGGLLFGVLLIIAVIILIIVANWK
jgi:hypothetical protein